MKVLSVAWTIYDNRLKEFCNNCTGSGLIIRNLCDYIGRSVESYLLIGSYSLPAMKLGNIHIVETESIVGCESKFKMNNQHIELMLKAFMIALNKIKPDVVNIHGIGEFAKKCIDICNVENALCVCTAHLYIGANKKFEGYDQTVLWENDMYNIPELKIVVVSTGMKKKIMKDFTQISEKNIYVIKNGTDFRADLVESDIKEEYATSEKKVLLCVGTLLARKNQCQLVDTFKLLPEDIQNGIKIIFCGRDGMKGYLQNEIRKAKLEDKLIYAGAFDSEEMKKFYSIADGMIMPSLAEGLSIAALEMLAYGKPVIMFSDSECAEDLNDSEVICFAEKRTGQSLADSIVKWYNRDWDSDYIKKYIEKFSMEKMAENYINYYKYLLSNNGRSVS